MLNWLWLISLPLALALPTWVVTSTDFTQKKDFRDSATILKAFDEEIAHFPTGTGSGATDHEDRDLFRNVLYGMVNGIALEIGALDGTNKTESQTVLLEKFGWKRILIEANPMFREKLSQQQNSLAVNAAICADKGVVHYATRGVFVAGIVEFMHTVFLNRFHPYIAKFETVPGDVSSIDFSKMDLVSHGIFEIPCVPMQDVIDVAGVSRIDLMVLDTEGAEYSILQTIDWNRVIFSVIIVETNDHHRSPGYQAKVQAFLEARGYLCMVKALSRNSWYIHKSYVPKARADNVGSRLFKENYHPVIVTAENYREAMAATPKTRRHLRVAA